LFALLKDAIDDLGALVGSHVKLARVELGRDVRAYWRRGAVLAVVAVLALVGYGFVCAAAALALARVVDPPLAYLAVGGFNLLAGGALVAMVMGRAAPRPLDETLAELDRTVATLTPARKRADGLA
jgi:hypothetical protein